MSKSPLRIKIIDRDRPGDAWRRQLPESGSFTGKCEFVMNRDASDYDWLVVVDDVNRRLSSPQEVLHCAAEHTLLTTTEPLNITRYSRHFTEQFAHVLTSQTPEELPHPGHIHSHPGNVWYDFRGYQSIRDQGMPKKTESISMLCSTKKHRHTMHHQRFEFCNWLAEQIPEMTYYGTGHRPIKRKHEALAPYRYHLAIENIFGPHHWTEKLADPFLNGCLPIYQGCTNVSDYFPEESFVEIDIMDREAALDTIRELVADPEFYDSRVDAIREAKRRVMEEHNLPAMIERIVLEHHDPSRKRTEKRLMGRRQLRLRHPVDTLMHAGWHMTRGLF